MQRRSRRSTIFEYHGWITLKGDSSIDEDEDDKFDLQFREVLPLIEERLLQSVVSNGLIDSRWVNGTKYVTLNGYHNHESKTTEMLLDFYRYVAEKAIGSYGLLYIYDDEDLRGEDNEFQVYVLAKGQIQKRKDPFLSPFIPTVEDAEEPVG